MLNDSLAPIKRAGLFFGFMGVAVASLTMAADWQHLDDQSSSTVAQVKIQRHEPTDIRFASVDSGQKVVDRTKRAIASSQQAMLESGPRVIIR
ncbi:hypothetical protein [Bosea psychrotolerans]|uniref:Uncharacterized protein n=1 Tax=Bosea psychrotolerans TaxID=1871628 RepID=A0A2S4M6T2_9HYPH|nr:hypothetical protein [Bosea psychrotolerans]POR50309.1 hypothetical protein CYD53_10916 [Bosea psychrotolerans]